ncbi:MmcQ/YjbR family DNA-binding protein [Bosea sp. 2KB_26]|uniref:MmcQ/YjbR family DNA-binding protein n=1 Tax=Bosea sp. 2KB_26 TaxID=3237475 RepID=UPI000DE2C016
MSFSWDEAVAYALTLPGAEISTSYGMPAVKVNGRTFLSAGHEPGSFCISIDRDTVTMLMEVAPTTYWQTAHYAGWPAVLVRQNGPDPDHIRAMIVRARDWNAGRPRLREKR